MEPLQFACRQSLPFTPAQIADQFLDLARWPEFRGFGLVPGIRAAAFETRTRDVVGTKIRVTNLDGSTHAEEIKVWHPTKQLVIHMTELSPPLSRLATLIEETWAFRQEGDGTRVLRSFAIHPTSPLAKPLLWCISLFLKQAVARHLAHMGVPSSSRTT